MDHLLQYQDVFGNYNNNARESMGVIITSSPNLIRQDHHHQKKPSPPNAAAAAKPQPPDLAVRCPRCDSTNTKFCYYNNYSLSQPRYFCKSCRRYWTKGGTIRNIPVGGGYRKNKRSTTSSATSRSLIRTTPEPSSFVDYNSNEHIDLSLAFALLNKQPQGSSTQLGFHSEFGSSHDTENAGYAFGNGGSGLDVAMGDPNKVLWGFPWEMNGESLGVINIGGASGHVDQIDSGRDMWNNLNYINSGGLM
ncbi:unnamed protein product [Cochlearia groenlandica]